MVFTVHMDIRASTDAKERAVLSKLNLVDLAGSERAKKTGSSGQALLEAQFINKSLSFLEQTVNALARKEAHVPFRQCKLTAVLKDALGGNSKTAMMANIWPEQRHLEETTSTLRFATRVQSLVTNTRQNESSDPALLLKRYERQVQELKQELAMRDTLSGRARVQYSDFSDAEVREVYVLAREFLEGEKSVDQLPLDTLKRIKETFVQCQHVYVALKAAVPTASDATASPRRVSGPRESRGGDLPGQVGDAEPVGSFNIGRAPASARPASQSADAMRDTVPSQRGELLERRGSVAAGAPTDRAAAFETFKRSCDAGLDLNAELKRSMGELAAKRAAVKELSETANSAKRDIDALQALISERRCVSGAAVPCLHRRQDLTPSSPRRASAPPQQAGSVVDVEEYELLAQLKEKKIAFRAVFDQVKFERLQLDALTAQVTRARGDLMSGFDAWLERETPAAV